MLESYDSTIALRSNGNQALTSKSCVKRTCWDTRATDSIIKSGQKDTEASILKVCLICTAHPCSQCTQFIQDDPFSCNL